MKRAIFVLAFCAAVLHGCATTAGSDPTVKRSGFDGANIVHIAGHGTVCKIGELCTGLGAQWNSRTPGSALLFIHVFGEYQAITGAELSIAEQAYTLKMEPGITRHETGSATRESVKAFVVPLTLIRDLSTAGRAWLRVHTTRGYVESMVIEGDQDSKAYHAMKRFISSVDKSGQWTVR